MTGAIPHNQASAASTSLSSIAGALVPQAPTTEPEADDVIFVDKGLDNDDEIELLLPSQKRPRLK